jgi:uncharacterized glyoxalase superfamily protein PhnB
MRRRQVATESDQIVEKGENEMAVTTGARLTSIVPQFLVLDLQAACTFYAEKLGFRVAFIYDDFYAGVERDGVMIHLKHTDTPDPCRQAKQLQEHLDAYINVDDIAALYAEYQSRGVSFAQPLETQPWGKREFVLYDADGFILYFGQDA